VAEQYFGPRKPFVKLCRERVRVVRRVPPGGIEEPMNELEQVSESLVHRSFGFSPSATAEEWRSTPLMAGLDKLFREIGAYLEFVDIARGG
jgi:hypothetical protein